MTHFDTVISLCELSRGLIERILGHADRRKGSETRGCFDRYYWCYKLHDVANARFQEAAYFLALGLDRFPVALRTGVRGVIEDGIRFWAGRRHRDGSVDEIYPNERSFCATSMSAQAVAGAYLELLTPPPASHDTASPPRAEATNATARARGTHGRAFPPRPEETRSNLDAPEEIRASPPRPEKPRISLLSLAKGIHEKDAEGEPDRMQTSTLPVIDWTSTGRWLSRNDNMEVANQMAAACLALERIGRLTGEAQWREAAWKKFQAIAEAQLQNGCYAEYGGPDIGYATITLSLLAGYHAMTGRDEILTSMRRCEHFLLEMVGPEGLYDWQHTTRRTQFLYPYGLAYLSSPVLDRLLAGLRRNVVINPLWMDDRYMIPMAIDYLLAARHLERDSSQGKK